jgi:hypothetical protein
MSKKSARSLMLTLAGLLAVAAVPRAGAESPHSVFTSRALTGAGLVAADEGALQAPDLSDLIAAPTFDPRLLRSEPGGLRAPTLGGQDGPGRVSVVKAGLLSLLLPGLGELYLGDRTRAGVFFLGEAALWTTFTVFLVQEHLRRDTYEEYAEVFAGVTGRRDDDYYKIVGQYLSNEGVGGYNESVRRDARALFFPDVDAMNAYYERNRITGTDGWTWESRERFLQYRDLREGANQAERRALYTAAAGILTRLVSVIDAVRLGRSINRRSEEAGRLSLRLDVEPGTRPGEAGLRLVLTRSF